MTRRTLAGSLLVALFVMAMMRSGSAALDVLPIIDRPPLTAAQAIALAEKQLRNPNQNLLVGIDWAKSTKFTPRFSDGTRLLPVDQPDSYSWFVTYVYKDDELAAALAELGTVREFTAVRVIRVKSDGTAAVMAGFRS